MQGRTVLLTLALVVGGAGWQGGAAQQTPGFAGSWTVEYPGRVRNENGIETVETGHARVVLQQKGDSLTGEWRALEAAPDGKPAPARTLRGIVQGNHASLETQGQAVIDRNGEAAVIPLTIRYELDLAGDSISGTQAASSADGMVPSTPRPVKGKRESGGGAG